VPSGRKSRPITGFMPRTPNRLNAAAPAMRSAGASAVVPRIVVLNVEKAASSWKDRASRPPVTTDAIRSIKFVDPCNPIQGFVAG
jgi:hypothetical protein